MGHPLSQTGPFVGDYVWHVLTAEGVDEKDRCHDHQRWAESTAGRLEQQDKSKNRDHEIQLGRHSGTVRQLVVEEIQIGRTERTGQPQEPILKRHVTGRRAFPCREGRKGQEDCKRQMDRTGFGCVQHKDVEYERQGRGEPELEHGPEQGDEEKNLFRHGPCRIARPGLRFFNLENFGFFSLCAPALISFIRHGGESSVYRNRRTIQQSKCTAWKRCIYSASSDLSSPACYIRPASL